MGSLVTFPLKGWKGGVVHLFLSSPTGQSFTTLYWCAPELLDEDVAEAAGSPPPHTTAMDVYSFGVTLWEIATGRVPFDGLSMKLFFARMCRFTSEPGSLHPLVSQLGNVDVPEGYLEVMCDCLR